jgi:hypothetical protein
MRGEIPADNAYRARARIPSRGCRNLPLNDLARYSTTPGSPRNWALTASGSASGIAAVHLLISAGRAQPHRRADLEDPPVHRGDDAEPARPGTSVRGLCDPGSSVGRPARTRRATSFSGPSGGSHRSPRRPGSGLPCRTPKYGRGRYSTRSGSGTGVPPAGSRSTWPPGTAIRCSPRTLPIRSGPTPSWSATTASGGHTMAMIRRWRSSGPGAPATTPPATPRTRSRPTGRSSPPSEFQRRLGLEPSSPIWTTSSSAAPR